MDKKVYMLNIKSNTSQEAFLELEKAIEDGLEPISIKDIIKFAKLTHDAIIPSKRNEDKCYDLYPCFPEKQLLIKPHETAQIPTGIISAFDEKWGVSFRERGSNSKSKLFTVAGEVDSGFRAEWKVFLYNSTHENIVIDKKVDEYITIGNTLHVPYSKAIAQFAIEEVPSVYIIECSIDEIKSIPSKRGEGMLGSSGK